MKKRILSMLVALALVFPLMYIAPLSVYATNQVQVIKPDGTVTTYWSHQSAWKAAVECGGTFKLLNNWKPSSKDFSTEAVGDEDDYFESGAIYLPKNKSVTIDLNGHNISRNLFYGYNKEVRHGEVIYLDRDASLTIKDTSSAGNGRIEDGNSSNGAGGIHAERGSRIYMYGGEISYCRSTSRKCCGGAVFLDSGAKMYMYGGKMSYNKADSSNCLGGGAVMTGADSRFYMYGGELSYNHAKYGAGAAYCSRAYGDTRMEFYGGVICNNTCDTDPEEKAHTIYARNVVLDGAEIKNNTADYAVYIYNNAALKGGSVHDNSGIGVGLSIYEGYSDDIGDIKVYNNRSGNIYLRDYYKPEKLTFRTFNNDTNNGIYLDDKDLDKSLGTADYGKYAKHFFSDREDCRIVNGSDGKLYVKKTSDVGADSFITGVTSVKSGDTDIAYNANVKKSRRTVTIHVPVNTLDTDIEKLAVTFNTTGTAASVTSSGSPTNGSAQNFTSSVIYTLLNQDGRTEQNWTVEVVKDKDASKHTLTVNNSTGSGEYNDYSSVTVAADEIEDKRFVSWNAEGVELTDEQKASQAITFTMPSNNVTLTANYEDLQSLVELTITEPSSGQGFDEYATVALPEGGSAEIPITWTPNAEKAEYGKTYTAVMSVSSQFGFAKNIKATVNGNEATVSKLNDNTIAITYEFSTAKAKLHSITAPTMNAANGTKFEDMQLPQKVGIMTTDANIVTADVTWETKPASYYNPLSLYAQQFTVKGTVTLPEAVEQNEVDLNVKLTVTVSAANTVESVQANLAEDSYTEVQELVLSTPTEGAEIYYNISNDGTVPEKPDPEKADVNKYTGPIQLGEVGKAYTYCISAIAVKDGMFDSKETVYKYRVDVPKPKYEVKVVDKNGSTAGLGGGTYCEGDIVTVKTTAAAGDHIFKNWSVTEGSLNLTDEQKISAAFTFTMPSGNVTLQADFIDAINKIELDVNAPEAGKILDTNAGYKLYNSASEAPVLTGSATDANAPVIVWTPSHTTAAYNTDYMAYIKLLPNEANDIVFCNNTEVAVDEGEAIAMKNDDGSLDIYLAFAPTAKAKLNSITAPVAINVPYNTPIENITLPSTVKIDTESADISTAAVSWDTSTYSPTSSGAQTINGTVILSDDVDENGKELTTTITINVAAQEKAPVPMANIASGRYAENQTVTLTAEGASAIYYTTDGSEPTTGSTLYTGNIAVNGAEGTEVKTTIKTISVADGKVNSDTAVFEYTIVLPAKKYTVDVKNGTGSGEYEANTTVNIMAQPGTGMTFTGWKAESVYYTTETVTETILDENGEPKEVEVEKRIRHAEPIEGIIENASRLITTLTVPALAEGRMLEIAAECLETVTAVKLNVTLPKGGEALPTGMTANSTGVNITANSFTITPSDTTAQYNTAYTMSVNIAAKEGYTFGENPVFSINGAAASPKKNTDGSYTVTYVYKTAKDTIASVANPSAVTDLPNGISMSNIMKKLPQTVSVTTEGGAVIESQVLWNSAPVQGSYDPKVKTEQTFKLSGILQQPETVTNPQGLTAEIEITVNAAKKYNVTVNGGSGSGEYEENSAVPIVLTDEYTDKVFTGWSIDKGNVLFNNPTSKNTFFIMPSEDVVVTANYRDKINNVELTADKPKAGETLPTEMTCATDGVTASLVWTPGDKAAGYNKSYTVGVKLKADSASFYEFADSVSVTVNGNPVDSDNITVNADKTITVTYEFTTEKAKLTEILPSKLTGVKNGTELSDMPLPDRVNIVTEDPDITSAAVEWDMSSAEYDPNDTSEQTFTITGTITSDNIDISEYNGIPVIDVMVSAEDTASAPIASPIEGTYTENQTVTLTTVTEDAQIFYAINDGEFTEYTEPIEVTGTVGETVTTVIKAKTVKTDMNESAEAEYTYTIKLSEQTYTLTVVNGSGSGEYKAGETITIMADAAAENTNFAGWEVSDGTVLEAEEKVIFTMPAEPVTVTAKYNEKISQLHCIINKPKAGEKLDDTITFEGDGIGEAIMAWFTEDITARKDTEYWAMAAVMPNSEKFYEFAENVAVTVNGEEVYSEKAADGGVIIYISCIADDPEVTPTTEPTIEPTTEPTAEPTSKPTTEPTSEPTASPTTEPITEPTTEPTSAPTTEPITEPTAEPTTEPTVAPTKKPSSGGGSSRRKTSTSTPSPTPTAVPTAEPTSTPKPSSGGSDSMPFIDVHKSDWFYDDVYKVYKGGLMNGVTDTLFAPDTDITRGMFVTVLYRMDGEPKTTKEYTFKDVPQDTYYAEAVAWASKNGIVTGYSDEEYMPDKTISREQMAAIMYRYVKYKGKDTSEAENTNILSYDDFSSISEYAISAMQWSAGGKILQGRTAATLNPIETTTRAEAAAVFNRIKEYIR